MRCPFCQGTEDRVVDSRSSREDRAIRRRRECVGCGRRFTTYEYVEERPLQILKRDGSTEPYDRHKILRSIRLPCAKRPIPSSQIEAMVDEIEDEIGKAAGDAIDSRVVGEMVMDRLRALDHVAYVRFASVYRNFQDIDAFVEELRELSLKRAQAALNESQAELPLEA